VHWSACLLAAALVTYALAPHLVEARTFHCGAGDVSCLIAAINEANTNGQKKNTIRLEAGTFTLTAVDNMTDGPNGLPSVTSTLTIKGAGAETTIIERDASAPEFRLMHVAATGTLTLDELTLHGGSVAGAPGDTGFGGGIFSSGTLTARHSTLRDNTANGGNAFAFGGAGSGGAIFSSGTLTVAHSTLSDNHTAGGVATGFGGAGSGGGIFSSGTLTVTQSTLSGNTVVGGEAIASPGEGDGGGIFSSGTATVTHSTLGDNIARSKSANGGGIFSSGTLTVTNSALKDNMAEGRSAIGGNGVGRGGGISNSGTLTVTNSTLRDNMAEGNSGNGFGGGIFGSGGTLTVTNSTLSGNTAFDRAFPGGIGGGIFSSGGGTVELQNTILALNMVGLDSPDCSGAVTSLGNNLIGDPTRCTITLQSSDLTGDPGLGAFTDNGKPGNGHFPLLSTSRAIDAGNDGVCPKRDQLGQRRVGPCDIGAIRFLDGADRKDKEQDDQQEEDLAATAQGSQ
jgi:hypothetical protein